MTQLAINTETFEKLLDVLDHRILQIKEALREVGLTGEAKEVLEKAIPEFQVLHSMLTLKRKRRRRVQPQRGGRPGWFPFPPGARCPIHRQSTRFYDASPTHPTPRAAG
jgi:hypothetical protein